MSLFMFVFVAFAQTNPTIYIYIKSALSRTTRSSEQWTIEKNTILIGYVCVCWSHDVSSKFDYICSWLLSWDSMEQTSSDSLWPGRPPMAWLACRLQCLSVLSPRCCTGASYDCKPSVSNIQYWAVELASFPGWSKSSFHFCSCTVYNWIVYRGHLWIELNLAIIFARMFCSKLLHSESGVQADRGLVPTKHVPSCQRKFQWVFKDTIAAQQCTCVNGAAELMLPGLLINEESYICCDSIMN